MAKSRKTKRKKPPTTVLKLPDLEQSKSAVLSSLQARRGRSCNARQYAEKGKCSCAPTPEVATRLGGLPLAQTLTRVNDPNLTVREQPGQRFRVLGSQGVTMARLIPFHVPQDFKPPKQCWLPQEQRGKIIEFHSTVIKKSA